MTVCLRDFKDKVSFYLVKILARITFVLKLDEFLVSICVCAGKVAHPFVSADDNPTTVPTQ